MRKAAVMKAVPMCVIMRYVIPDLRVTGFSSSWITNRNEVNDISSQNNRKENTLFVATTRIIDRTKRLIRNPTDLTPRFSSLPPL